MTTPRALIIIIFLAASAVHLQASENEKNAEGIVVTGNSKATPSYDEVIPALEFLQQIDEDGQVSPDLPENMKILFKLEIILYCFVLLYGLLHLPFWETLYNRYNSPTEDSKTTDRPKTETSGGEERKNL
ncbi:hypothetical protein AALO_G00112630 [Alosa alosa]|uniref:Uncharacterized protein n=1 Tax=Alosa alosa TaxID=278164 RepID=A0AAV6GPF7_9TELE|nr:hypothetical protein AALO_G00112630 [Alosa alosa]